MTAASACGTLDPLTIPALVAFGAKVSPGGAHLSRTMMLGELMRLLAAVPGAATLDDYRRAVIVDNVLGKGTASARGKTFGYLQRLYGLAADIPLFSVARELIAFDILAAPLLALLVAWCRDPVLRATTPVVLPAAPGDTLPVAAFETALNQAFPGQYSSACKVAAAQRAASTWTQSGHLTGRTLRTRCRVEPRPAALTLALLLGHLAALSSDQLFASPWCRLLDLDPGQARALTAQAHRADLLTLRAIDTVVEVSFPRFDRYPGGSP